MARVFNSFEQYLDNAGNPVSGGTLVIWANKTTTSVVVHSNPALTVVQTNPYTLDASGRVTGDLFFTGIVSIQVNDINGAQIRVEDDIDSSASSVAATGVTYTRAGTGAVATDVDAVFDNRPVDVKMFGAKGNGTTDDTAAINAAYLSIGSPAFGTLYFPEGTYLISSTLVFDHQGVSGDPVGFVQIKGDGRRSSVIKTTSDITAVNIRNMRGTWEGVGITKTGTKGSSIGMIVTSLDTSSQTGPFDWHDLQIDGFNIGLQVGESGGNSASELTFHSCEIRKNTTNVFSPDGAVFCTNITFLNLYMVGTVSVTRGVLWESRGGVRFIGGSCSDHLTPFTFRVPTTETEPVVVQNMFSESHTKFLIWGPDVSTNTHEFGGNLVIKNCLESQSGGTTDRIFIHAGGNISIKENKISGVIVLSPQQSAAKQEACSVNISSNTFGGSIGYRTASAEHMLLSYYDNDRGPTSTLHSEERAYFDSNGARIQLSGFGKVATATPIGFTFDGFTPTDMVNQNQQNWFSRIALDDQRAITSGVGTIKGIGEVCRIKETVQIDFGDWSAAATTKDLTLFSARAGHKIVGVYANTTTQYAGTAGTLNIRLGKTTNGNEYLVDHDVKSSAIFVGDADADLGTSINRSNAVQGGDIPSTSTTTSIRVRLTSSSGNLSSLSAGSTTFVVVMEMILPFT